MVGEAELALRVQQSAQVADRLKRVRVIAPQSPLASFESAAKERLRETELALLFQQLAGPGCEPLRAYPDDRVQASARVLQESDDSTPQPP